MKKITILIPAYNEGENLVPLSEKLHSLIDSDTEWTGFPKHEYEWEILVVDDGSTDNTPQVLGSLRAADPRFNHLSLSRNFGKERALLAGLDYATGDCVVIMDADLQHPTDKIPEMIHWWEEGYDDVYGERTSRGKEPFLRRKMSKAYYSLLKRYSDIPMLENAGDFRLLDRCCVDALRGLRESERNTKGLYCWVGFKKKGVSFETGERNNGKSSFNFMRLLNLALDGLTGFSTAPLRFASVAGFATSFVSFIYLMFILAKTIFWGETVQGFPTLICVILFLGGCQLIALGIIGEYIARIFNETKQRPPYVASHFNGKKL